MLVLDGAYRLEFISLKIPYDIPENNPASIVGKQVFFVIKLLYINHFRHWEGCTPSKSASWLSNESC
jgi:hypothetical protein